MENLKWEVDQKEREIQSLKQQLDLTEQQSRKESDGTRQSLQVPGLQGRAGGGRQSPGQHGVRPQQTTWPHLPVSEGRGQAEPGAQGHAWPKPREAAGLRTSSS